MKDRDEAGHWIELRHTGENEGAGIVRWGSDESARFRARTGGLEVHSQALDLLERRGDLTPETRSKVPTTSFKRLIETPEVRSKLGVEVQDGKLCSLADEGQIAKALMYVVDDLVSGKTKVGDIYRKSQRLGYADNIPTDIVVAATIESGHGAPVGSGATRTRAKPTAGVKPLRPREKVIPRDCVLNITDPRVKQIEGELRKLKLEEFPNAISVLFRVFIELSADSYIERMALSTTINDHLGKKLQDVAHDLVVRKKLTTQQARPVNRAAAGDALLAPSVRLMQEYVHNQYVFPGPSDIRAHWDSLQPFITAIWAP